MEKKKISFRELANVLSSKEMKNITGGTITCKCTCSDDTWPALCPPGASAEECQKMSCPGVDCGAPDCDV